MVLHNFFLFSKNNFEVIYIYIYIYIKCFNFINHILHENAENGEIIIVQH